MQIGDRNIRTIQRTVKLNQPLSCFVDVEHSVLGQTHTIYLLGQEPLFVL